MNVVRIAISIVGAAVLVGATVLWVASEARPLFPRGTSQLTPGDAARGKLIFAAADCASCHARPGQPDRLKLGGGMALASPYGTFRVPNISPDPVDGIGTWTVADLANALVSGVSPEGEHYYPAFPYTSYTGMRIEDIQDLYAYLKSLPPVSGKAPPHDLYPFARVRRSIGLWKLMFFSERQIQGQFNGDPVHDRGAYLVETVAHCAECHSKRNIFGAIKPQTRFAGARDPEGTGFVPNITPARIGAWSVRDIAEVLKSGDTPDHGRVGSSMADVVTNTAMLPQSDRDAIAAYIRSLPARRTPKP
jgi:mono/diheme cytochrome c family protein